jgi:hypothetical protein
VSPNPLKDALVLMLSPSGARRCTGTLLNNTAQDGSPLVLTARHCNTTADAIFVFDYYKDHLRTYNSFGNPIDTLPLFHQYNPKKSGWKNNLIQDKSTGDIYALYERSGYSYLGKIDLTNAQIKETVRLTNRYIDKISIKDEFVYYIYRPFESAQKKYLYKERLPYNLPEQPKETIHE